MSKKAPHKGFIIGIAVAVLLPLSFSLFFESRLGSDHRLDMPRHYIADRVDSQVVDGKMEYDTAFHKVSDFELTNQLGDKISLNEDLAGKIIVIDFFFVSCPSV